MRTAAGIGISAVLLLGACTTTPVNTGPTPDQGTFRFQLATVDGSEIDYDSGGHTRPALTLSGRGTWSLRGTCDEISLTDAEPGSAALFVAGANTDGPCDDLEAEQLDRDLADALAGATNMERFGQELRLTGPGLDALFLKEQ